MTEVWLPILIGVAVLVVVGLVVALVVLTRRRRGTTAPAPLPPMSTSAR